MNELYVIKEAFGSSNQAQVDNIGLNYMGVLYSPSSEINYWHGQRLEILITSKAENWQGTKQDHLLELRMQSTGTITILTQLQSSKDSG